MGDETGGLGDLGGEADPSSWHFAADHGPLPNPVGHAFPLLTHDAAGTWELIGTGFYVSADGLFVTAAHVVDEVLDGDLQVKPLVILQLGTDLRLFGGQGYHLRPIMQAWLGKGADVALGAAGEATHRDTGASLETWFWPMTWRLPNVGAPIATYAFPNHRLESDGVRQQAHFQPDAYPGLVEHIGEFRDAVLVPYPFMHVTCRIHGAASGGPVFADRRVVGVNCRYLEPNGPGVVAQIRCIQHAFLDDVVLLGETIPRRVTFSELVAAKAVVADGYMTEPGTRQEGRVVRLDREAPTAPMPNLTLVMPG